MLGAILDWEAGNINRFGGMGDPIAHWFDPDASLGIGQIKPSTAKELEDAGYMPRLGSDEARYNALMDNVTNIQYAAAKLSYTKTRIQNWYADQGAPISEDALNRLTMLSYNQGWDDDTSNKDVLDNLVKHSQTWQLALLTESLAYTGCLPNGTLVNDYHVSAMWSEDRINYVEKALQVSYGEP